jgi:hypothetical protein
MAGKSKDLEKNLHENIHSGQKYQRQSIVLNYNHC